MKQIHKTQIQILKKLLFNPVLRYLQMKPEKNMENNQFQFHLDKLLGMGLVAKNNGKYKLTQKGKEYANRIDEFEDKLNLQAKISVWIACTRKRKEKLEFLIGTRLKQPFYGCQGYLSGKVKYGEKISAAVKRELKEESNLECKKSTVVAIKHITVVDKHTNSLLEDKFMYLCWVDSPTGKLKNTVEGKFDWVSEDDLDEFITNPYDDKKVFWNEVDLVKKFDGRIQFIEEDHYSSNF